jgi:hypothetical protein
MPHYAVAGEGGQTSLKVAKTRALPGCLATCTALMLREAMALRGRMNLASYDRLFPSQDLLPAGGIGNLIAAPLFKPDRGPG